MSALWDKERRLRPIASQRALNVREHSKKPASKCDVAKLTDRFNKLSAQLASVKSEQQSYEQKIEAVVRAVNNNAQIANANDEATRTRLGKRSWVHAAAAAAAPAAAPPTLLPHAAPARPVLQCA